MAFEFSLERVLNLAESEKRQLEIEYQTVYQLFEQLAHRLFQLIEKKNTIQSSLQEKFNESISIHQITRELDTIDSFDRKIQEQIKQYEEVKQRLEQFQDILQGKNIEIKKYERLKQSQLSHHKMNQKKKELQKMDETGALKFIRQ
ncbi:flagellar export protein FliJ [Terrilactibacillus sp. BCM23-1]|uniref:Flagellar FliJ protein n=1 Tax=Terrilactibacillus tamarindi TaxID=2599694 RepID=A0A6N8CRL0_9BACI|nr:flagellar export protein FliJ [Terrilactibacillus tamarindi]MTT32278.1 flagellar export protein FliJ [Terrilactibacillus tamarindi]